MSTQQSRLKFAAGSDPVRMTASVGGDPLDQISAALNRPPTVRRCVQCDQIAGFAGEFCSVDGLVGPHSFYDVPVKAAL